MVGLLRAYERVLAVRPLGAGNKDLMSALVQAARQLARELDRAGKGDDQLHALCRLISLQSASNSRVIADRAVTLADAWLARGTATSTLLLTGRLPALAPSYDSVTWVFGPGLGLGDEIAFATIVGRLASLTPVPNRFVLTQYPQIWPELSPQVSEIVYRGDAMTFLRHLRQRINDRGGNAHLVIFADYEHYRLREHVLGWQSDCDVLEVSLARATAWYTPRRSGATYTEKFAGDAGDNLYSVLHGVAERLVGDGGPVWKPVRTPQPQLRRLERVLLVNPLSSKPVLLSPRTWASLLVAALRGLSAEIRLRIVTYPGVDDGSAAIAIDTARAIASAVPGSRVELLGRDEHREPRAMGRLLARALAGTDLCVTLDTFTGHLAPLLGVPTLVLAYADNHRFWVPSPWSWYCLPEERERDGARLIAHLLAEGRVTPLAETVISSTNQALLHPTSASAAAAIFAHLSAALQEAGPDFPFRAHGIAWLAVWSRLQRALQRTTPGTEHVLPYLRRWQQDEFMKTLAFGSEPANKRTRG